MSDWFEESFESDVWLRIHRAYWTDRSAAEVAERVERLLDLAPSSRVLDVPCGTGQLSGALADRGHRVHGVDLSEKVLAAARTHLDGRSDVVLERGDMRRLEVRGELDAAVCWWGSFGYFGDQGDEAFVRSVRDALKPGAPFLVEGFVMESLLPGYAPSGIMRFGDIMVVDERRLDLDTSMIESTWTVIEGEEVSERMEVRVRLYPWLELQRLFERAGFEDVRLLHASTLEPFEVSARGGRTLTIARCPTG